MAINELFDGIAGVVEQFVEQRAEQKLLEKAQQIGRDPEVRFEKTEKEDVKEKEINPNFSKTG